MGWTTSSSWTLKSLLAERTANQTANGTTRECLAHCFRGMPTRGGNLWTVWKVTGPRGKTSHFIALDVIKYYGRNEGWGYKDMDESVGPNEVNCPLSYLDMVDRLPINDFARQWRKNVRAYHAKRKATYKIKVGQTVKLRGANVPEVTILSLRPLRGTRNGMVFVGFRRFIVIEEAKAA